MAREAERGRAPGVNWRGKSASNPQPYTPMKTSLPCLAIALGLILAGCGQPLKSARSLQLPQGHAENGKAAFVDLKCVRCHTVVGVELPKPTEAADKVVALGGDVARLRTIGDLLTSIIHPSAVISEKMPRPGGKKVTESPMPVVNDDMTVTQMIDLVTFLQPRFTQIPPPPTWHQLP